MCDLLPCSLAISSTVCENKSYILCPSLVSLLLPPFVSVSKLDSFSIVYTSESLRVIDFFILSRSLSSSDCSIALTTLVGLLCSFTISIIPSSFLSVCNVCALIAPNTSCLTISTTCSAIRDCISGSCLCISDTADCISVLPTIAFNI